jgi:signal transduction histidine kinase
VKTFAHEDLAILDLIERPIWVFDIDRLGMWWANQAGVAFWNARDLAELQVRDFSDMSPATVQQIAEAIRRGERGERVRDGWTVYPRGQPVLVYLTMTSIHIENGRVALWCEAVPAAPAAPDESVRTRLRGIEALRHLPVSVCELDSSGQVVFQNPEALRVFGPADGVLGLLPRRFADHSEGERMLREIARGEWLEIQAQLETLSGPRWFHVSLGQSTDPVHGGLILLFTARDISEHRRDRERLQRAREEAEAASLAESAFLAMATHELRTPLHGVRGAVELLAGTALDHEQQGYLHHTRAAASSLLALLDDLLDLARLEAGRMDISERELDLDALLDEVTGAIGPRVRARGLILVVHRDQNLARAVRGDARRLRQMLMHLLDSAVERTSAGEITMRIEPTPDRRLREQRVWLRFEVTAAGAGEGDPGLGLAICRLLAERMGGATRAERRPGGGSRFWVDLPLR